MTALFQIFAIQAALALTPGKILMDVEVRLGERQSHYRVTEVNQGQLMLEFMNNAKENRKTQIKASEFDELKKIGARMTGKNADLRLCPKQYIKINFGKSVRTSCESAKSPLSEKMRRFVNLLRFLI